VGLVDHHVVDAGGLEGDAGVLGGVQLPGDAFLGARQRFLDPCDQPAAGRVEAFQLRAQRLGFLVQIDLLGVQ
jgi:hypothetical protein